MAWVTPQFSRTKVDAAGDYLAHELESRPPGFDSKDEFHQFLGKTDEAFKIISNWRSSHSWPLLSARITLMDRARKVDREALISQRLKRMIAILTKLRRFRRMKLAQMQDIGGCRAVLRTNQMVERLDEAYRRASERRQKHQSELIERYDYIKNPKADGYRGIHLVSKYHTQYAKYDKFHGLRVEVQLRSRLQHEWATAVETVDLFTTQALKSSVGEEPWKRFFLLMGGVFALKERRPVPPGLPLRVTAIKKELRQIAGALQVEKRFSAWSMIVTESRPEKISGARTFLLTLDIAKGELFWHQYTLDAQQKAETDYAEIEKQIIRDPQRHAVLVSVASIRALRQAYPSFYADTTAFMAELREALA
ncbi:MAG: RelA/SpoT domain-containing protein [Gemmatimonadales bacterium]